MIRLRCLLGRHRTIWVPVTSTADASTTSPWEAGWLRVRRCRDCGRTIGRQLP